MSGDAERELLKDALLTIRALKADLKARDAARREPIAIIGIGCRFPGGANTPDAFWELLRDGVDAVGEMPAGRWDRRRVLSSRRRRARQDLRPPRRLSG